MSVLENKCYREMQLVEGEYVPETGIDYPTDDPLARLMPNKIVREYKNDENYPFIDDSFGYRLKSTLAYAIVANFLIRIILRVKFGLKIEGREILKNHKEELKGGIITVANHCFPFDAVCIYLALGRRLRIPMLPDLFAGSNWWLLTHFGGVPLADGSLSATKKFNEAFDEFNRRGEVVHIFAEARSWPFYKPLRPFQKGAFTMAYKWGCPVVPMSLSYRPRTGLYKLFGNEKTPLITLRIGEPIFPDKTAPRKDEVDRLLHQTHASICALAGIIKNPWPAVWND